MICSSPCVFLFFSSSFRFVSFLALSLSFGSYMWMCALVGALRLLAASLSRFTFLIDTALHILIELQCGSECIFSLHNNTYVHRVYVLCVSCCCCRRCCCCCFFRFIPFLLLTSFFSSLDFFLGLSWRCMCSELRKKVHIHMHLTYAILEIDWREEKKLYYWEKTAQKMCLLLFKRFVFWMDRS